MLKTRLLESRSTAENLLRERAAATFILLPEDFSQALADIRRGERRTSAQIVFGGDLTNPYYMISSILATTAVEKEVVRITAQAPLLQYVEEPLGASAARTEFENYVPGILVFAVIMLVFLAAMTVAREVESGTLRRLQLTPLTSLELLGGISAALVLVGVASVFLTFFTAVALGFHSQGPLWLAILIGAVTSLSIIGVGMLVACFSRTVSQAFVIANFPLGLLMFFSGSIFPIPAVKLFTVAGRAVSLYDALPATHAVAALHKKFQQAGLVGRFNALHAVQVLFVAEIENHLGLARTAVDDGVVAAARLPKQRPGDGIQQRRLARAVVTGDAGDVELRKIHFYRIAVR